jgi:hypothetical protein
MFWTQSALGAEEPVSPLAGMVLGVGGLWFANASVRSRLSENPGISWIPAGTVQWEDFVQLLQASFDGRICFHALVVE